LANKFSGARSLRVFISRFGGVSAVGFLSYIGEYSAYYVVWLFISDKLVVNFGLGTFGYLVAGTLNSAYLVVPGIVAVPIGHLSDKYGRRRFAVLGCLLGVFGLSLLVVGNGLTDKTQFWIVMGASLCALGTGHGMYTASTLAYTGDIAGKHDVMGKSYGLIEGAEFAGYAFGPFLGTSIAVLYSRVLTFEVSAFMLLVAAGIAFVSMPEIRETIATHVHAQQVLAPESATSVLSHLEEPDNEHFHGATWSDYLAAFKAPIINVSLLTTFVGSVAYSGFYYYVPAFASKLQSTAFGLPAGDLASIMALTAVILMVPFGHLEDKGRRRMPYLAAGMIVSGLSISFIGFAPSVLGFVVSSLTFGTSIAVVRVSQLVLLAENCNPSNRAAIMGTNHAVEHAGYGMASIIVGALVAFLGFAGAFRGLSLILLAAGLAFLLYAMNKKVR